MQTDDNEWIATHQPCPHCGSSDAFSVGTRWSKCFSCGTNKRTDMTDEENEDGPVGKERKPRPGLLADLDFGPIKSRGLTEETCRKFGYATGEFKGEPVQVAQYFRDGSVVAQKLRTKDKKFTVLGTGKDMPFYGQHLWGSGGKIVVITEGEIDALSVSQVQDNRWPVVSLPNGAQAAAKTIAANLEWLETYERVVLMFDMDEPGRKAVAEAAEVLSPGKAFIAHLPLKDANACLLAGKGDEIRRAIWNAAPYRPDAILAGSELLDRVLTYREPEGVPWPWEALNGRDAMLKLSRPGIHTLVAGTGSGKSTVCRAIEHHLIQLGENVGCLHLEEDAIRSAMGIIGYHLGARIDLGTEGVDEAVLKKAFAETAGRDGVYFYDSFGSTEVENVLAKVRYLAKAGRCRFIILDHLSIIVSGLDIQDERKAIDVAMTKLRTLAEECRIALILVCHLNRQDGKDPEKGGEVTLKMLRGSQSIAQLSDSVSSLERNQQAEGEARNLTLWRVLKCRWTGCTGPMTKLLYDRTTGRLNEVPLTFGEEDAVTTDEFQRNPDEGDFTEPAPF